MKYPDYLDILVAITGRAPFASCHDENRRKAEVIITVEAPNEIDDAFWPTLGYRVGTIATNAIPLLDGLQGTTPSHDDLKAFGAAFATTSAAPMFHIAGITPEALTVDAAVGSTSPILHLRITRSDLKLAWDELNSALSPAVELVALGNPHFSVTECRDLAALCRERKKHSSVDMIVTCGREVFDQALKAGYVDTIRAFGAKFLNDTCWCLIGEPVVRQDVHNIMTNSGKYAHYGPAAVVKGFHFGSLRQCVEAAETGSNQSTAPPWLQTD